MTCNYFYIQKSVKNSLNIYDTISKISAKKARLNITKIIYIA